MVKFFISRVLFYMATLPILICLILWLMQNSNNDPVDRLMRMGDFVPSENVYQQLYLESAKKYHLSEPIFYFSILPRNYSRDYFGLYKKDNQKLASYFLDRGARYEDVNLFLRKLEEKRLENNNPQLIEKIYNPKNYSSLDVLINIGSEQESLSVELEVLKANSSMKNKWIPRFFWHGRSNQFHHYIKGLLKGQLGRSYLDFDRVENKLWRALQYTLIFAFLGLFISIPLSLAWGKYVAVNSKKWSTKMLVIISYLFYSMPLFWLCTLLLVFFTTDDYVNFGGIFSLPKAYLFEDNSSPIRNILMYSSSFILPLLAILLHQSASFGRFIRILIDGEMTKPYILTAKMKGLSQRQIVNQHAYSNIRLQVLTAISGAIPGLLAGSVVIESIFNIPGLGRLTYDSVKHADMPMLMGIVILIFTITTLVYTITDYLYLKFSPNLEMI